MALVISLCGNVIQYKSTRQEEVELSLKEKEIAQKEVQIRQTQEALDAAKQADAGRERAAAEQVAQAGERLQRLRAQYTEADMEGRRLSQAWNVYCSPSMADPTCAALTKQLKLASERFEKIKTQIAEFESSGKE